MKINRTESNPVPAIVGGTSFVIVTLLVAILISVKLYRWVCYVISEACLLNAWPNTCYVTLTCIAYCNCATKHNKSTFVSVKNNWKVFKRSLVILVKDHTLHLSCFELSTTVLRYSKLFLSLLLTEIFNVRQSSMQSSNKDELSLELQPVFDTSPVFFPKRLSPNGQRW